MDVPDGESQSVSTWSWTNELTLDVDPGSLSPKSRATYELIWAPIRDGMKPGEIATELGRAPSWVSDRLREFYLEFCFQQGVFPPPPEEEYDALYESIAVHGVQVPVVVDENGDVIDGRLRRKIARELRIACPVQTKTGLSLAERRELAVMLNASRRHLTRQQKRQLVVAELMVNDRRSDREIGRLAGVDGKTVGKARAQLVEDERRWSEAQGEIEAAETPRETQQRERAAVSERLLGEVECPCCQNRLELWRRSGEYMLDQILAAVA